MNKVMFVLIGFLLVGLGLVLFVLVVFVCVQEGFEMVEVEGVYDVGMIIDLYVYLFKGKMVGVVFLILDVVGWGDVDDVEVWYLCDQGQVVVGLDLFSYLQGLEQYFNDCVYVIVDIEDLLGWL